MPKNFGNWFCLLDEKEIILVKKFGKYKVTVSGFDENQKLKAVKTSMLVQFQKASIPYAISDDCFPSSVASSVFACYLEKATGNLRTGSTAGPSACHHFSGKKKKCLPSFLDKRKINAHGATLCILQYARKHYRELVTWYFISRKK